MQMVQQLTGSIIGIILLLIMIVWGIMWFFVPFLIYGIYRNSVRSMEELQKLNSLQAALAADTPSGTAPRLPQRFRLRGIDEASGMETEIIVAASDRNEAVRLGGQRGIKVQTVQVT